MRRPCTMVCASVYCFEPFSLLLCSFSGPATSQERELFISLLEILGALMQTHPDEFPTNPQLLERTVVLAERLLAEEKDENRVPGVYIIDDILQHLGVSV